MAATLQSAHDKILEMGASAYAESLRTVYHSSSGVPFRKSKKQLEADSTALNIYVKILSHAITGQTFAACQFEIGMKGVELGLLKRNSEDDLAFKLPYDERERHKDYDTLPVK
jgi:hypothetical protein